MLFSSITFIYFFLPVVLLAYFIVPNKVKNAVLLFASIIFYGWGEPKYVILMLALCLIAYISGILISKYQGQFVSKLILSITLAGFLLILGIFKYADFFIESFNKVTGLSVSFLNIALPIGISFYIFQSISYVVDIYKDRHKPEKNLINLAMYISLFPQLIAGPIVRYEDIADRIAYRRTTFENLYKGAVRFVIGLGKKVLIANQLAEIGLIFKDSQEKTILLFWLYAIAATLQIYFDFSGYSDMAIGLGRILGFEFPENFNYPYISTSITEFWRRWHMSLGRWFRDYVYIPLGGNRKGKIRWFINIGIVWALTGLWHGASWNFVIWGLFYALVLLIEKAGLLKFLNKAKVFNHIYVMIVVVVGFVFFNEDSIGESIYCLKAMVGGTNISFVNAQTIYYLRSYLVILIMAVIGSTPLIKLAITNLRKKNVNSLIINAFEVIIVPIIFVVCTAYIIDGSFNPFLYFRF